MRFKWLSDARIDHDLSKITALRVTVEREADCELVISNNNTTEK